MIRNLCSVIADNGTRTRTNRAEVCYATPTTSYPQIHLSMMTMTIYTKIKIKIKRFFSYFIIFYKKWLFYIRLWLLMLILQKEKSLNFAFYPLYFDRARKSDLEFYQTLSLFYILFLISCIF